MAPIRASFHAIIALKPRSRQRWAGDFEPFEKLNAVLGLPFDDQPENAAFADPPKPDEVVRATFCGT